MRNFAFDHDGYTQHISASVQLSTFRSAPPSGEANIPKTVAHPVRRKGVTTIASHLSPLAKNDRLNSVWAQVSGLVSLHSLTALPRKCVHFGLWFRLLGEGWRKKIHWKKPLGWKTRPYVFIILRGAGKSEKLARMKTALMSTFRVNSRGATFLAISQLQYLAPNLPPHFFCRMSDVATAKSQVTMHRVNPALHDNLQTQLAHFSTNPGVNYGWTVLIGRCLAPRNKMLFPGLRTQAVSRLPRGFRSLRIGSPSEPADVNISKAINLHGNHDAGDLALSLHCAI